MDLLHAIRGMNDLLPRESRAWQRIESAARAVFERYGYREIRTPIVEETRLFQRSIGETTDIVEKEMYTFPDRKGKLLTLRPENTAGVVRAVLEHGLLGEGSVQKLFYVGPMFRYERPQKGRYRQFHQIGAEAFGAAEPLLDAEMIAMACAFLRALGLSNLEVRLNSLGETASRAAYRETLLEALRPQREALCADCQRRFETNPLRVLDCKVEACQAIARGLPAILDVLDDGDRAHLAAVEATLTDLRIVYRVDKTLVRGLDYYTRTIFEVAAASGELGAQNTLVGGGRYNHLVEQLGGAPTPAIGFAFGVERLALLLGEGAEPEPPRVFLAALGSAARAQAARLAEALRSAGVRVEMEYGDKSLKAQLRRADKMGARCTFVLGDGELARGAAQLKDMQGGAQRDVPLGDVVSATLTLLSS
jgi:histidyl-tRNA synthetase